MNGDLDFDSCELVKTPGQMFCPEFKQCKAVEQKVSVHIDEQTTVETDMTTEEEDGDKEAQSLFKQVEKAKNVSQENAAKTVSVHIEEQTTLETMDDLKREMDLFRQVMENDYFSRKEEVAKNASGENDGKKLKKAEAKNTASKKLRKAKAKADKAKNMNGSVKKKLKKATSKAQKSTYNFTNNRIMVFTQCTIIALLFAAFTKDMVHGCCKKQTETAKKDTPIIKETVSKTVSRCLENPENRGYTPLITRVDTTLTKSKENISNIEMITFTENKNTEEKDENYQIPTPPTSI